MFRYRKRRYQNNSQLVSEEFEAFRNFNNIVIIRSPPYHPSTNGHAEHDAFNKYLKDMKTRSEGIEVLISKYLFFY